MEILVQSVPLITEVFNLEFVFETRISIIRESRVYSKAVPVIGRQTLITKIYLSFEKLSEKLSEKLNHE